MFVRQFAEFVRTPVVAFAMGDGRSHVSVGGEVMQFGCALVRSLWHEVLLGL